MTTLQNLHRQILKEQKRIEMLKNTKNIDADFFREETNQAKNKIAELQKEFNAEYEFQNS
jgi:hypothetical protein